MKAWTLSRATAPSDNLAIRAAKEDAEAVLSRAIAREILDKRRKVLLVGLCGDSVIVPPGYPAFAEPPEFYKRTPRELLEEEVTYELRPFPAVVYFREIIT
jgi:hypothetical protein